MKDLNKYYLMDIDVKEGKMGNFQEYWKSQLDQRRENGGEHIGTWTVIAGEDAPMHVQSLFKLTDFRKWVASEVHNYHFKEWIELVDQTRISVMHLEDGNEFEKFLGKGNGNYYAWTDIELKANKQVDFRDDIKKPNSKMNADLTGEHIATFTVLAGKESTVHIKRLSMIKDPTLTKEDISIR